MRAWFACFACAGALVAQHDVHLVAPGALGTPAEYGLQRLEEELAANGLRLARGEPTDAPRRLVVGTRAASDAIAWWLATGALALDAVPEALAVARIPADGVENLVVAGHDSTGLMYALLEIAEQVEFARDAARWFESVPAVSERPANAMRRMRVLFHHEANERDWYYSREYWDWYLDTLARNRFNGLNLVYSHQTSYLAPMYAWHVRVDEYPDVRGKGLTEAERTRNLDMLRYIAATCRDRGIELTLGIWQHMPWISEAVRVRGDQPVFVEGLSHDIAADYSYRALKKLLHECPGIARIQLRPNDESGIPMERQTEFYSDWVMRAIKEAEPEVRLDLRTVGVHEATIERARTYDFDLRTSIKFFGEFMGLPFTPTEVITRGYSYRHYLQKPLRNEVYNEVWMLGSHRVLLWGSESYGRRFGRVASYGGTIGFETDGHLAQKGFRQPTGPAWRIFADPDDEYFEHEMERYWAFYRSIGRFGYAPGTDRAVWMRPFERRFGAAAEPMARAYEAASEVVGLICASHVGDANMYVWPEISMGGILGIYTGQRGMDKFLFPSIDEYVARELDGRLMGIPGPARLAARFERIAAECESALAEAEAHSTWSKELQATARDFRILAGLARFHAHRQREGYAMARFHATSDASLLATARAEAEAAVAAWHGLLEPAAQYFGAMVTGPNESGHWADRTAIVDHEPELVGEAERLLREHGVFDHGFDFGRHALTYDRKIFNAYEYNNRYFDAPRFTHVDPDTRYHPTAGYGFTECEELGYARATPIPRGTLRGTDPARGSDVPLGVLEGDSVVSDAPFRFRFDDLAMRDHRFTFVFAARSQEPQHRGPMQVGSVERRGVDPVFAPFAVRAGDVHVEQVDRNVRRSWYPYFEFEIAPAADGAHAVLSALTVHRHEPRIAHAPARRSDPSAPVRLSATITMPPVRTGAGLSASSRGRLAEARVLVRRGHGEDFRAHELTTEDGFVYGAAIDAGEGWLEYRFEAASTEGRVSMLPEVGSYWTRVTADTEPPAVEHEAIRTWRAGVPMPIAVRAIDPTGVAVVRVHFRVMDQTRHFQTLELGRQGEAFVGTIPGAAIEPEWDFKYVIEAADEAGNGCVFPDWTETAPYVIVAVTR